MSLNTRHLSRKCEIGLAPVVSLHPSLSSTEVILLECMSGFQGTTAALLDFSSVCLWLPLLANAGASAYLGLCFLWMLDSLFSSVG